MFATIELDTPARGFGREWVCERGRSWCGKRLLGKEVVGGGKV